MKKIIKLLNARNLSLAFTFTLLFWSCSSTAVNGDLVGASNRAKPLQPVPFGMTFCPEGSFLRGSGDQDPAYQQFSPKTISINSFYIDETEITNNEYRQFVQYVIDSITRRLLAEQFPDEFLLPNENEEDDTPQALNWKVKIKNTPEVREVLEAIYLPADERFYNRKGIDVKKLNYEFYTFNLAAAAAKSFDPQDPRTDNIHYSAFVNRPQSFSSRKALIKKEIVNVYPDTLCWIFDWAYAYNEPATRSYFSSARYDNYPVVGVNWRQAKAFCKWRTIAYTAMMESKGYTTPEEFRLPTEAEWEYAARGGSDGNPYPWGGPYSMNENGCYLGNFKPQRGNYTLDGAITTCIVGHYAPNDYGIYDMMGNVSEWCEDAYEETYLGLSEMNPAFTYDAKDSDEIGKKRKVIRGGSFKDFAQFTKVMTRDYEYQDSCKSHLGFRCVQSYLGRDLNDNLKRASNVYFN